MSDISSHQPKGVERLVLRAGAILGALSAIVVIPFFAANFFRDIQDIQRLVQDQAVKIAELESRATTVGADGPPGRSLEMRSTTTHLQWRLVGDTGWSDLVALDELRGPPGQDGAAGVPGQAGTPGTAGRDGESISEDTIREIVRQQVGTLQGGRLSTPPAIPSSPTTKSIEVFQDDSFDTQRGTTIGVGDASSVTTPFYVDGKTHRLRPGQSVTVSDGCTLVYRGLVELPFGQRQKARVDVRCPI
ncbi:hypothetical protein VW23_022670 [Devosia insulae DS-56]|uniref:Uncharacterized protein n=1 Tax=Devosia insulae DS-56 TaxID=1116389 RepID=A0A1E5XNI7_9HYPH|nr:hypothetical protein VW23_022670 [Devosia insulae DS-56]